MRRGTRVLVLLSTLVVGLALLLGRGAVYEATATATAVDVTASGAVSDRATRDGFRREVADALAADPVSVLPALVVTRSGAVVQVSARDADPARAEDTVDTAVFLLARGETADAVDHTTLSTLPVDPVNRSSLAVLGGAALALTLVGVLGSWLAPVLFRRRA